ncbi:hypothetical protein VP1G_00071 [Cytospora mali]|uniref:Ubiquitin-like domain-containing protein n=1 Tax=Cytospora mali TaxID=578113 RepID=A0A194UM78_CYTMA|nr:hypothetical protein VP1G_00071 [Valsa mali var. pyri (nom. inval.)]
MSREKRGKTIIDHRSSQSSLTDEDEESYSEEHSDSQEDEDDWVHEDDIDPSDSASATADYRARPQRPHSGGAARNPSRHHSIPRQQTRYAFRAPPSGPPDPVQTMSGSEPSDDFYSMYGGRGHFAPPPPQVPYGGRGGYPQSHVGGYAPPPHPGYGGQMVPFSNNPFSPNPLNQGGASGYFAEHRPYDMMPYQHQQPGFYGGASPLAAGPVAAPNYGMPAHLAQYMYSSPPPPPTEAPAPAKTPAPAPAPAPPAEEKPNPEIEAMKAQLAALQAERKAQEEAAKQADIEKKIRQDAEKAFVLRMEEMKKAQEEAKKEIELAKIEAEKAARERIEEERKAEAERQRQHAEMMARAEREARERIEKERKEEAERARQHAEAMAKAEREAKEKYEAALKAEEERKEKEAEERKRAEETIRLKIAAEAKAAEEAKKLAEKQAAEEAERKKLFEEELRLKAEKAWRDKVEADKLAEAEKKAAEAAAKLKYENEARIKLDKEKKQAEAEAAAKEAAKKEREELEKKIADEAKAKLEEEAKKATGEEKEPIKFKDAVGRKFNLPFNLCATWNSMEDLIKQAFAHVDVIGPHVQEGHYDLMGPDGDIILPIIWDKTIQPGWQVTMRMWPMDKHPLQSASAPPGMPDPRNMTPEQRHRWSQHVHQMRQAQAAHHAHGRPMPMRPPPGMAPPPGMMQPAQPPPGAHFPFGQAGPGTRLPAGVDVVDAKPERKKGDGKTAKKTISFFAGGKKPAKKSSSSKKYVPAWQD